MSDRKLVKYLFVINSGSGTNTGPSWTERIHDFFDNSGDPFEIYELPGKIDIQQVKKHVLGSAAQNVIAVGGDGTIALLANILVHTKIPLGILPAGSANGMARELGIPDKPEDALKVLATGITKSCDLIKINGTHCLHLSDLGLNAQLIKYFDEGKLRGKWGYAKVIIKTLVNRQKMNVTIKVAGQEVRRSAFMVALANAQKYGTGAVINPEGAIDDGCFEVVIVKRLRFGALLRMLFKPGKFNPRNIEIISCTNAEIKTHKPMHFQVDGEYEGKERKITASIEESSLRLILPLPED